MKDGICPKCDSRDVHKAPQSAAEVAVAISMMRTAFIEYYICTGCGFVELYVQDRSMLPHIAEKYPKVN